MEEKLLKIEALKIAPKGNVLTEGIITNLIEGKTKRNDPYISCVLVEKDASIEMKVWSEVCDKFTDSLDLTATYVYQVSGTLEEYEGKKQLNVKSIVKTDKNVEDFTVNAIFPTDEMYKVVTGYVSQMKSPTLKVYLEQFLKHYENELKYYPLSALVHSEKGGLMSHIFNCVSRAVKLCGDPKKADGTKKVNTEIVVAAICLNTVEILRTLKVNNLTGSIIEQNNEELKAQFGNAMCYTCILPVICASTQITGIKNFLEDANTVAMLHAVLAINNAVEANSLEAVIAKNIVYGEIEEQAVANACTGLIPGETTKAVLLNGSKRTVFLS